MSEKGRSPNQAMQLTASSPRRVRPVADKAATDVVGGCHPRFGCVARCTGLAVADLTRLARASIMIPVYGWLQSSMIVSR